MEKEENGITSTYVENTLTGNGFRIYFKDHLHIRGEYSLNYFQRNKHLGSPPHTWRIHYKNSRFRRGARITSTYVENTKIKGIEVGSTWDHLHIRGEYGLKDILSVLAPGSPPHTWRILLPVLGRRLNNEDHLHIRGEYSNPLCSKSYRLGSPPHTWRILG